MTVTEQAPGVDPAPFVKWIDRLAAQLREEDRTPWPVLADAWGVTDDGAQKRVNRWRREGGPVDVVDVQDGLEAFDRFLWEFYDVAVDALPDDAPAPIVHGRPVDARGRDLTKRRGVPSRLTDRMLLAAHRLHVDAGLSLRELGRRGWEAWGYASPKVAAVQLSEQFKRLGLPARDRIEATRAASTVHGRARRAPYRDDPADHAAYRRELRVARGEVRDVRCAGVRQAYPRKGARCQHFAMRGSEFCAAHDPALDEQRREQLARARALLGFT